jgi:hypothetical protein
VLDKNLRGEAARRNKKLMGENKSKQVIERIVVENTWTLEFTLAEADRGELENTAAG